MIRRIFCLFLALFCVGSLLAGCSNTQEAPTTTHETTPINIMQKSDPSQDDNLNVLMIGNSFCYYYVEELYGMLTAAGYKNVNICNVYYSGCTLEQHWTWWKNGIGNYEYFTTNETGRNKIESTTLEYCLKQHNWDFISLQDGGSLLRNLGAQARYAETKAYLTDLLCYIKEQYPLSRYLWHHTWTYQIGYYNGGYTMATLEQQETEMQKKREFTGLVCKDYDLERVNSGEAWQIVRQSGYDNLCARLAVNNGEGDYYHDGDIGGGQYLNACVWFEAITGESCIGNTYRPDYTLDESLIPTLQEAAHKAIQQAA